MWQRNLFFIFNIFSNLINQLQYSSKPGKPLRMSSSIVFFDFYKQTAHKEYNQVQWLNPLNIDTVCVCRCIEQDVYNLNHISRSTNNIKVKVGSSIRTTSALSIYISTSSDSITYIETIIRHVFSSSLPCFHTKAQTHQHQEFLILPRN